MTNENKREKIEDELIKLMVATFEAGVLYERHAKQLGLGYPEKPVDSTEIQKIDSVMMASYYSLLKLTAQLH